MPPLMRTALISIASNLVPMRTSRESEETASMSPVRSGRRTALLAYCLHKAPTPRPHGPTKTIATVYSSTL